MGFFDFFYVIETGGWHEFPCFSRSKSRVPMLFSHAAGIRILLGDAFPVVATDRLGSFMRASAKTNSTD
jgi:hypothetical protein